MEPELLDAYGGTGRFQVSPASLAIRSGRDALACLQQTRKGALRWYAACCKSTLGLTLAQSRVPFVGLDVHRIDRAGMSFALVDVLGPVRACLNGRFERSERRAHRADVRSLLSMLAHLAPLTWRWWRRGDQRRSPFFDAETGAPVVEVVRLSEGGEGPASDSGRR